MYGFRADLLHAWTLHYARKYAAKPWGQEMLDREEAAWAKRLERQEAKRRKAAKASTAAACLHWQLD